MQFADDIGARMGRLAEGLAAIDPDVADRRALEHGLRGVSRLRSFCDAVEAGLTPALEACIREALRPSADDDADREPTAPAGDAEGDTAGDGADDANSNKDGASDPTRSEPDVPRESADELARRLARAKWLRRCEQFAAALLAGSIKGEHIDALAAVLNHVEPTVVADVLAEEDRLLEVARRVGHVAFGRYVRDVVDRVRADGGMSRLERQIKDTFAMCKADELTGMYTLFAKFDPIRGAEIAAALQRHVEVLYQTQGATTNLSYGQVVANALHELLCAPAVEADDGGTRRAARPGLLIVADAKSFVEGEHPQTMCETAEGIQVPIGHARSLIADAVITVAVAGSDGRILNVGRIERLANWAQRFALRAMYRHCAYPGCRVPESQCHVHHVIEWDDGGPTDLGNLLPVCFRHHHKIHDEHWRLTIDEARTVRCYRPDGTLDTVEPFVPLIPTVGRTGPPGTGAPSGSGPPPDGPAATSTAGPAPPDRTTASATDRRRPVDQAPQLFDPAA